jgi:hypothetical protein
MPCPISGRLQNSVTAPLAAIRINPLGANSTAAVAASAANAVPALFK